MPPNLRKIVNDETGEQALFNPETNGIFNYPDSANVITNDQTGQQALYDTATKSLIGYLPRTERPTERPSATGKLPVRSSGAPARPSFLQRMAIGPLGGFTEDALKALAAPAQFFLGEYDPNRLPNAPAPLRAAEYLTKSLVPFPEFFKPEGERGMEAIARPLPEVITRPIVAGIEKVKEFSPDLGKLIEDAMAALPPVSGGIAPIRTGPVRGLIRRLLPEKVGPEIPREPAFIEALKPTPKPEIPPLKPPTPARPPIAPVGPIPEPTQLLKQKGLFPDVSQQTLLEMPFKPTTTEKQILPTVPRRLYAGMEEGASIEAGTKIQRQRQKLRQRLSEEGEVISPTMPGMRQPEAPNAPPELPSTAGGRMAVPTMSPEIPPKGGVILQRTDLQVLSCEP